MRCDFYLLGWLCWVYCTSAAHSTVHTHCARASRVCGVCAPGWRCVWHPPGVVATKVRYFWVKLTKVPLGADGTKPAKVAHRPSWPTKAAKPGLFPETEDLFAKRSSLRKRTKVAEVGPPRTRVGRGVKSAKVPPTPYAYYPRVHSAARPVDGRQPLCVESRHPRAASRVGA